MTEQSKQEMRRRKKQTRNSQTAKGLYDKVRSKFVKGPDGYGEVVSKAREMAMERNGGPLPKGMIAHHVGGGASNNHSDSDEKTAIVISKSANTAESNMRRAGKTRAFIKKKLGF